MSKVTRFLIALASLVTMSCAVAVPGGAQVQPGPTTVRRDLHHDVSLPLIDMMRTARAEPFQQHEAEPRRSIPLPEGLGPLQGLQEDAALQPATSGFGAQLGLNFDGIGDGKYGFTVMYAPPDTVGAVGATQYVQWVNAAFAIFDKRTGAKLYGPVPGNVLWSGFGGGCESNNNGDPVVLYDKLANRWVMSQFSVSTLPYLQCIAVSTTPDATGAWHRYSFQYTYFDDYPKMGVWPDAYYETFNMFDGNTYVGSDACAYNRTAMLNGQTATQVCFQQNSSVGSLLPSDLDGTTPPPAGSPNYVLSYGAGSLLLYKFHVDFGVPSNSTFTGPTTIPVAAFTPLCYGASECVPQPGTTTKLDSLADRLMYRLAYRKFPDHESLVVTHSVNVGLRGGVRWYEIQSPNSTPRIAQQGTYAPDSNYRWMSSAAMDKIGDLAVGYSVSSDAVYPGVAFAGRVPSDPAGALEAETTIILGTGSQTGTISRWGDYSAMTVDPVDDCTFWYTQEYMVANGAFNWNTRIASFKFPGCASGAYIGFYPDTLDFGIQPVETTSAAQQITLTNYQAVPLLISNVVISGDYQQTNNCGTSLPSNSSCRFNVSFHPTAAGIRSGTLTVTDNGPGGGVRTASLTGLGTTPATCVSNTLSNSGFESGTLDCWTAGGALAPDVSALEAHGASFSAQLGATGLPQPNGDSWIYQTVTVPTNLQAPTLTFWFWPSSQDSIGFDWQEAQIRDTGGNTLAQVLKVASNSQSWTYNTFDLTPYKGQTVQLYFNVHEDGDIYDYLTYMYLDDIAIVEGVPPLRFRPVTPCRVVDTRNAPGAFGGPAITGGSSRSFAIPQGSCSIPAAARAYALNVTAVPRGALSYLTIWPTGSSMPVVSTLNSPDGRTKANAAIVPAGTSQAVSVYASNTTDVILDVSGYFVPDNTAYAFFPLAPCRVVDTRGANGPLGGPALQSGQQRDFPLRQAACGIPSSAQAYSLNITALPQRGNPLGYLTAWPAGQSRPGVSTLNAPTGTNTANAAIVPAGTAGDIMAYASNNNSDLLIDINGYFAAAGSGPNPMSFYNLVPCRVLDTRGLPPGTPFTGQLTVSVAGGPCPVPMAAQSYVLNATVIPASALGYLTLWPDGQSQPVVSTLNAADGAITSNMAIVPTSNGYLDAYASALTQLILDIAGYFAP